MEVMLPCGKTMYLRRDAGSPSQFHTLDKEWTGTMDGDRISISRADGWKLDYVHGKLSQLRTDNGRRLTWVYTNGLATQIREDGSANISSPLTVEIGDGGQPRGIVINGKEHFIQLDKRPIVKNEGKMNVVEQLQPSLSEWKFPDGSSESYAFAVTPEVVPSLKVTDSQKVGTTYTWDPYNGHILSDGEWTYTIGDVKEPYGLPKIERTNAKAQNEFTFTDLKTGITDRQTLDDGHRITQVFSSPGVLYGKVRRVEEVDSKGNKQSILQLDYDDQGRIYRKIDDTGFAIVFSYGKEGRVKSEQIFPPHDPLILGKLASKEKDLIKSIASASTNALKQDRLQELAFFYLFDMHQTRKALELASRFTDKQMLFHLKLASIADEPTLNYDQKIMGYRKLITEFPEQGKMLQWMIDQSQEMIAAGL